MADIDDELIELAAECATDPLRWALHAYDWGHGELEGVTGPRAWQREVMSDIGNHLKNPATRFQPLMLAVASGHGIGKSAEIGMIVNCAMMPMITSFGREKISRKSEVGRVWPMPYITMPRRKGTQGPASTNTSGNRKPRTPVATTQRANVLFTK